MAKGTKLSDESLWTSLFAAIVVATFCLFLVSQGLNSGTTVYLDRIGLPGVIAGLLAAITAVVSACARIFSGHLVDKLGRAAMFFAGAMLLAVGTFLTIFAESVLPLVLCRVIQGVGFALATTATAAMAADILPSRRLGEGIGYYGLGQALAMAVGPLLALSLAAMDPPQALFIGLTAVSLVVLALVPFCRYEENPEKRLPPSSAYRIRWEKEARDAAGERGSLDINATGTRRGFSRFFEKGALPGTIPMMALAPVFGFGIVFVGLYGGELGVRAPGLFFTLSAASMIAVRLLFSRRLGRANPRRAFGVAAFSGLVCFSLLLAAPACIALYYLAGLFYGVCLGIGQPLGQSIAVAGIPSERLGAASALYLFSIDAGFGLGALAWGALSDLFGFGATIACVMTCIVLSLLLACRYYPRSL